MSGEPLLAAVTQLDSNSCNPEELFEDVEFTDKKVQILDYVVKVMFSGGNDSNSRGIAHGVLEKFKNMPNSWRHVAVILEKSTEMNTKYFALQILDNCIQTRWNILPENEKTGITQYVSEMILNLACSKKLQDTEKHIMNKVNENLIQIVKREWPDRWPTFMSDICESARMNQAVCENNMRLLNILSEEVFDFGRQQMVTKKVEKLMTAMASQFQHVFDLCMFVLEMYASHPRSVEESLVTQTLQCLSHFIRWIPYGYIFKPCVFQNKETCLPVLLIEYFWGPTIYKIECLRCLTEIFSIQLDEEAFKAFYVTIRETSVRLAAELSHLPLASFKYDDPAHVAVQMRLFWETFYLQLSICLTSLLKNYQESLCDRPGDVDVLLSLVEIVVNMTRINHDETFKICLDYWGLLAESLVLEWLPKNDPVVDGNFIREYSSRKLKGLNMDRKKMFSEIINSVRIIVVKSMAKPQEVYIRYDEDMGEVTTEYEDDTDEASLYNQMRDLLILLTNFGPRETVELISKLLSDNLDVCKVESAWDKKALSRICYSIGAISGALDAETEDPLLVDVLKQLLRMFDLVTRSNKVLVSSCLMHVCAQYTRFLNNRALFLLTVVRRTLHFMQETFPGIADMAVETFLKISQRCAASFSVPIGGEPAFLDEIIRTYHEHIAVLVEKQALFVYEGIGNIIHAAPMQVQPEKILIVLERSNRSWAEILDTTTRPPEALCTVEVAREMLKILRINQRIAKVNGASYTPQLVKLCPKLLEVYQIYSSATVSEIQGRGMKAMESYNIKILNVSRRHILQLIGTYLKNISAEPPAVRKDVAEKVLIPLLMPILDDYRRSPAETRLSEVLTLVSSLLEGLGPELIEGFSEIFSYVFDSTIEMIRQDFRSFPDHREKFYEVLVMANRHCFKGLFSIPPDKLAAYIECLAWAFKHELPVVAEQGLRVTYEFIEKLIKEKREVLQSFCERFYYSLLQDILMVMTDRLHQSGFMYQTLILMQLIRLIELNFVEAPEAQLTKPAVMANITRMICSSFQTVSTKQVETFSLDLFNFSASEHPHRFQYHIRDFLISLKEFVAENDESFDLERKEALERLENLKSARRVLIPGMAAQFDSFVRLQDIDAD